MTLKQKSFVSSYKYLFEDKDNLIKIYTANIKIAQIRILRSLETQIKIVKVLLVLLKFM